jgi:NitT/TauT family transport system ATP-binding protein
MNMTNGKTPLVEMKNVAKKYRLESGTDLKVLSEMNLALYDEEIVALLGPTGSGKSTCLRIMSGLTDVNSGQVLSQTAPLMGINTQVAMIFQSFALLPWEKVLGNIALALSSTAFSTTEQKARVKKVIDLVGLEGFEEAYPRELSGGMKQRVGIARALVMDRPVLFLDEPFGSLDVLTADTLRAEILEIFFDKKTATRSMLMVTHNINEAVFMAKRILVMGANPGKIRKEIINDLPYPRDEQSVSFQRMVAQTHALITETLLPDAPVAQPPGPSSVLPKAVTREPPIETLPNVPITEVIGLLEAIGDQGGTADIFELSHATGKEFGRTLYLVKAAELLDLLDSPKQRVVLTELGRHFVEGDINLRKRMLHELFGALKIVQMTANLLKTNESLRTSIDDLKQRVHEWLPNEDPAKIVDSLVSWGRFAEYFGYNDDTKEVYLDVGQETV